MITFNYRIDQFDQKVNLKLLYKTNLLETDGVLITKIGRFPVMILSSTAIPNM